MCRQHIGAVRPFVDQQYPSTSACEQHGGRRASTARSDDNRIEFHDTAPTCVSQEPFSEW